MNRTTWRTALFSGLVCCASSAGLWAQSPADVETGDSPDTLIAQGKGKDGGGGGAGRGDNSGNRGGSAPHSGSRNRLPSSAQPRQPTNDGQRTPGNRSPSFSNPKPGRQPGATPSPSVRIRPPVNPGQGTPGGSGPRINLRPDITNPRNTNPNNTGVRGNAGVDIDQQRPGTNRSNIRSRPFTGNTVNFNDRQFHVEIGRAHV